MTELGVYTGNEPAGVSGFESWIGKSVDAALAYTGVRSWTDADPGWQIDGFLGKTGRDLHWSMPIWPDSGINNVSVMRDAASGAFNSTYTSWAKRILAFDTGDDPIYVRPCWELGGEWFYWTEAAKQDPAAFRGAFQQFAKAFHDVSPRFKIAWDVVPDRGSIVDQWYPGDEAVDVISQDVYWHPQWDGSTADVAFARHTSGLERGLDWLASFAAQHNKPMAIPEWGVPGANQNTYEGQKFIELMKNWISTHNVAWADYWNSTATYDGLLSDNDPSAAAAALKQFYINGVGGTPTPTTPPLRVDFMTAAMAGSGDARTIGGMDVDAFSWDGTRTEFTRSTKAGLGVQGGRASAEIDHNPTTGRSEALVLNPGTPGNAYEFNKFDIVLENLSTRDGRKGLIERAMWEALDAGGKVLSTGYLDPTAGATSAGGSAYKFQVALDSSVTRAENAVTLRLTAASYKNGGTGGDSSDYSVREITFYPDLMV